MSLWSFFSPSTGHILKDVIDAKTGVSSSMDSAAAGYVDELRTLYDCGARFNNQDNDGWTPLFYAVSKQQIECVRYLLSVGVDVNKRAADGWSALMVAIDHGQFAIVQMLLAAGSSTSVFGRLGQIDICPLVVACRNVKILEALLEAGADPNLPHPVNGAPPAFFWGIFEGDPEGLRILKRYGADFNIADRIAGQTPIMVNVGNADRAAALIECGADPCLRDRDGESAFDYARKSGADPRTAAVISSPERVRSYFGDRHVAYAADSQ